MSLFAVALFSLFFDSDTNDLALKRRLNRSDNDAAAQGIPTHTDSNKKEIPTQSMAEDGLLGHKLASEGGSPLRFPAELFGHVRSSIDGPAPMAAAVYVE